MAKCRSANLCCVVATCVLLTFVYTPLFAATVVYDNTTWNTSMAWSYGGEHGDEITLAGTARIVTEFTFGYFFDDPPLGDENARIRFYENNGPDGTPGTKLYDSGAFSIGPASSYTLSGLAVPVPDTFTWTVEWDGSVRPYVLLYDPPTVGFSADYAWKDTMGGWVKDYWTGSGFSLKAQVKADVVPECEGDFDSDGDVDGSDLVVFAADFGRTDCPRVEAVQLRDEFGGTADQSGEDMGECMTNFDCMLPMEYCAKPIGHCEEPGTCIQRPGICPLIIDPVCGCDGVTYTNECIAASNGVSVAYPGECKPACKGDFDHDEDVDGSDLDTFAANFGRTDCPGFPGIEEYLNSGCLPGSEFDLQYGPYPGCGDDEVEVRVDGQRIHVLHKNATYNCCPDDIKVFLSVEGDVLKLMEQEILTHPCYCLCCYNVKSTIINVPAGIYMIEYCWEDYETGPECYTLEIGP